MPKEQLLLLLVSVASLVLGYLTGFLSGNFIGIGRKLNQILDKKLGKDLGDRLENFIAGLLDDFAKGLKENNGKVSTTKEDILEKLREKIK